MDKFSWQLDYDFQHEPREKTDLLQEKYLLEHVNYALQNSPFYQRKFQEKFGQINSISEFEKLELTTKEDLLQYNNDFLAVSPREIVDTSFTSASIGTVPVNFLSTKSDWQRLTYNERAAFEITGITANDTVAICVALERGFMAGLAYYLGGSELGAHMLRIGVMGSHVWNLIKAHRPTVLIGLPSVLASIAVNAIESGEDPTAMNVQKILAVGEAAKDKDLQMLSSISRLEKLWGAKAYSTYASTEMAAAFPECECRAGGHMRPELIYVEILDEEGQKVPDGELGEVVVTPLGVTGMPLLRFRTGDISFIVSEPCACGRTTRRIGPVVGRKAHLLKYKGTNVFPTAIASIVGANDDFSGCYVEAHRGSDFGEDRIVVYVAPRDENYDLERLRNEFRVGLRVVPEIAIADPQTVEEKVHPKEKRKPQIFFDLR